MSVNFTKRQKTILKGIISAEDNGISLNQLTKLAGTSDRTIYREFKELNEFLVLSNLEIKNIKGRYILHGAGQNISEFKNTLNKKTTNEIDQIFDANSRQNAIATFLLLNKEATKISLIAEKFYVSVETVNRDLTVIKDKLKIFDLRITNEHRAGINIIGNEYIRRYALINILSNEINEFQFFQYFDLNQNSRFSKTKFLLQLFPVDLLFLIKKALYQSLPINELNKPDRNVIRLILSFTISIYRNSNIIQTNTKSDFENDSKVLVDNVLHNIRKEYNQKIDLYSDEKIYLAEVMGSFLHQDEELKVEDDLTDYVKVRKFINQVFEKMNWNFHYNHVFFYRLSQHIFNLLLNNNILLSDNKLIALEKVSENNSELLNYIIEEWNIIFQVHLPINEFKLLMLYFVNEYNQNSNKQIRALVVSEGGIGTSTILKNRLANEVPAINKIKITKSAELKNINLDNYDLILSTLKLSGLEKNYHIVTPILSSHEISTIKTLIEKIHKKNLSESPLKNDLSYDNQLSDIASRSKIYQYVIDQLEILSLESIRLRRLDQLIEQIIKSLDIDISGLQRNHLKNILIDKYRKAPVGIPDSSLIFLHAEVPFLDRVFFKIINLPTNQEIIGINNKKFFANRVILMLAPSNSSKITLEMLSTLSTTIIMSTEAINIFCRGELEDIKELIAKQLLDKLKIKG